MLFYFLRINSLIDKIAEENIMRKFLLILFITVLTNGVFAQEQLAIRKKIVPLHSSRDDVESIARFVKNFSDFVRYETDNEFLDVYYSQAKCVGHGWNVPAGRVLSYSSYPKHDLSLADVTGKNKNLIQISDDVGTSYFINQSNGIEFVVRFGEEKVEYIGFSPTVTDSDLRCKGFPEYNLVSDHYAPYQVGSIENISNWNVELIYATLAQVNENPDQQGYVFIYCKKGQKSKCKELKQKIEKFANSVLKSKINQLVVTFGGYRSDTEIEVFLIPKDKPPAVARPTFPSRF